MAAEIAERIPLVRRTKAPGLPLDERITQLTDLTAQPAGASHRDLVARACGVLNYAALIASDVGMPQYAAELCWRQHQVFAESGSPSQEIAVMSLMPLVNIARLLIREGDGEAAYSVLHELYGAAKRREGVEVQGHCVDLAALIHDEGDHRKMCEELWVAVLIDGARALASIGRWTEAAQTMAAHRGVGNRMLDGRQILIMSLMERGLSAEARATVSATEFGEPWEASIAALLNLYCCDDQSPVPHPDREIALQAAYGLVCTPEPPYASFQVRVALTALDLAADPDCADAVGLRTAAVAVAAGDAYAARAVLHHDGTRSRLDRDDQRRLAGVLAASGLDAGTLPKHHADALATAVDQGEATLRSLLTR